ncbi:MAG: precorrin-3B C(17)-methyltransferase [Proteobacteria bacterium]|nr:precorrin-3B C(17)-methyltransferase [Pseudomonadota bacterium]
MHRQDTAIWVLSRKALGLGFKCADLIHARTIFAPLEPSEGHPNERIIGFDRFTHCLSDQFHEFQAHIFIMASGIVVRGIAPLLKDKTTDPAVVVMDEAGNHIISLISGHLGGANELSVRLASLLGADPVITTATDVNNTPAVDDIARKIGATIENKEMIKKVATCMLNQAPVALICDRLLFENYYGNATFRPDHLELPEETDLSSYSALCLITEKHYELTEDLAARSLFIRPPNLVVGIGCNKDTSQEEITQAVNQVFRDHMLSLLSIAGVATIDVKINEPGLAAYAQSISHKLQGYPAEELNQVDAANMSAPSVYAEKYVGAKRVAEPAALLGAGPGGQLIIPKQKSGNVTVAVALKKMVYPTSQKGKLFVVGIGPGDMDFMTAHARRILENSDVIAGYKKYIDLIAPLISKKEIISTGMTKEIERVDEAIRAANKDKVVALVCSGDAGIYGMAGLVYERMQHIGIEVETEVSPGVSAAIAAASLLGAPLVNDFITLSLSNLLTPTETVIKRIELAAASDMVTAIYNPVSKKRTELIHQLRSEFLKHRKNTTFVGVVTHALRIGQKIQISTLGDFLQCDMDMNSIIIIGNSDTGMINDRMVTRRGYERK